ncbi:MAG: hypothetical protein J6F30_00220 [Cellulosilyticum sp.]|nr:hypothetical protein [Cellulosilyticum sp.]
MKSDTFYTKCEQENIDRITALVNQKMAHSKLNGSPSRKSFIGIKRLVLVATLTACCLSTLTFATNIDLPAFLKQAYNQLFPNESMADVALNAMQPLEGSCIFDGIKAQLIGYVRDNDVLYVTFSLQDLEGDRLDESTFIYNYSLAGYNSEQFEPYGTNYVEGFNSGVNILHTSPINEEDMTLVSYDATTKTAIFNYRFMSHENPNFLENGSREFLKTLELTLHLIASGAKEGEASLDLSEPLSYESYTPPTIQADFDDFRRNGYVGYCEELQTFLAPDAIRRPLLNVPGVVLSNCGIIDNRLHVQIKYERPTDISINRILDMTLKSSQKVWDANREVYLKDGEYTGTVCRFMTSGNYYAEYIFDLPADYTLDDLELVYYYRTYDYIIGMSPNDYINLHESEASKALWKLQFNPSVSLEEMPIPFKLKYNGELIKECTAYASLIGLMLPESPDFYCNLYYETFNQKMQLIIQFKDGSKKYIPIHEIYGFTKPDETGKTKLLFSDLIDIRTVEVITLTSK